MAGVTVPSVLVILMLAGIVVLRFGYNVPIPIERFLVFPLAIRTSQSKGRTRIES
jgi:hypothetical protein